MNSRSAQHAYPRLPARGIAACIAACFCLLASAASASAAAPDVTIGSFPPLNSQSGTFSFDADGPALKFQCKLDAGSFADCVSPVPVSGLSVSTHSFSVRAIGLDNSIGTAATYTWTIDITRPAVPALIAPADNLLTNNPTPTFSGTAEPFAHVPLFDGSTQIANPQAGVDGAWSYTPAAALDDGTHLWRARAIDASGNRSDYTALRTLKIDTVAPIAPAIFVPAAAAKINARTPQISGSAEPQSTVAVYEGATRLCSTAADPAGAWSCVSSVQLPDGTHTVDVSARDAAGNESPTVQRSFELDATPPSAPTIDSPLDGFATTDTSVTVAGTADPIAVVKVLVNGVEVADEIAAPDGSWSHTFTGLAEGNYAYSAKEIDDFANRSPASNVVNVRVDRTAPSVTVSGHPPSRTNQTGANFALTASEPNVDFECALDGTDWQPCGATPTFSGLSAGAHDFKARGTDRAGNLGADSALFSWTIDLTPPDAPTIDTPLDGALVTNARPRFQGHAEPSAAVEVFVGASSLGTVPASSISGAWALTPGSDLPQGLLQIKARAIDAAGNVGPFGATRQLTVDSIAPRSSIQGAPTGPTNASTVTLTFSADDPQATFTCSLDGAAFAPCSSPYTTSALTEATHTFRVRGKDPAGNVETPIPSVSFIVDRTPPVGQSSLIAGSAGNDGIPKFQIASDDAAATSACKVDNGAFVPCSGQFKPAAAAGLHALTVRHTDLAGNVGDEVFAFNVVPVTPTPTPTPTPEPTPGNYEQPAPAKVCKVLGSEGLTSGRMEIVSARSSGRNLTLKLSAGAASLVRVDVSAGGRSLGSIPLAVKAGSSKFKIKLKRSPSAGSAAVLAVTFYSVKREFGTAKLAMTAKGSSLQPALGAQSTFDTTCPAISGSSVGAKLSVTSARVGARSFRLNSRSRRPGLVAIKVFRAGGAVPIVSSTFVIAAGEKRTTVKLLKGAKLASGGYKFTYSALGAGGRQSSGRGAFLVR